MLLPFCQTLLKLSVEYQSRVCDQWGNRYKPYLPVKKYSVFEINKIKRIHLVKEHKKCIGHKSLRKAKCMKKRSISDAAIYFFVIGGLG